MLTVRDHNDRAAATYAAVDGQYWIEALRDGRHVLSRGDQALRIAAFFPALSPAHCTAPDAAVARPWFRVICSGPCVAPCP